MDVRKLLVIVIIKKVINVNNFSVHRKNTGLFKYLDILIMSKNEQKMY